MKNAYAKKKQQLQAFIAGKKRLSLSSGQCCITIHPTEFSLAYTRNTMDKLVLEFYATYPYDSQEGLKERLAAIVKQYQLKRVDCSCVLAPQDYQLIQMDELPVKANEFQAAIRWKIKDSLRFPLDDVVIEKFDIPVGKNSISQKMMVVAAQRSHLQKISDDIKASGLKLSVIDIPELALRNMMALSEQTDQTLALVYLQNSIIQLLITYQKKLYFSRSLEFGWGGLSQSTPEDLTRHIEQLAGEIHRSFDYYEGQWRQPAPTQVAFAATTLISTETLSQLSKSLALPVQWLNFGDKFVTNQEMDFAQQGKYLPIIGELFRREYERDASAS